MKEKENNIFDKGTYEICEYCNIEFLFNKKLERKHYFCCLKHSLYYLLRDKIFKIMDKDLV